VARLTLPAQTIESPEQERLCESLSFTPWHALPEHEPVGGINRVRRAVYQELSRYRHAQNGTPRAEPRGFCLDPSAASCEPEPAAAAPTAASSPAGSAAARPAPTAPSATPGPPAATAPLAAPTPNVSPVPTPTATPTPTPTPTPPPSAVGRRGARDR
jgi:hypothetical protein